MLGEAGPCTLGVISWPSNCSQDDAVHLWKAACVRECHGSWAAQGPDMYSGPEKPARCPWTGGAHSLRFTLAFLLWDLVPTTSYSVPLFSYTSSFPSIPPHQSPKSIHHHILTSICCLPGISWLVIVFLLGLYSQKVCCLMFYTLLSRLSEFDTMKIVLDLKWSSTCSVRLFTPTLAVRRNRKQRAGRHPSPRIFIWPRC